MQCNTILYVDAVYTLCKILHAHCSMHMHHIAELPVCWIHAG